jgi:hypothetical protein|tara:strand:+ start:365 stop:586 length:222 start_codon:yes stop_codon:yes gene_type:complete
MNKTIKIFTRNNRGTIHNYPYPGDKKAEILNGMTSGTTIPERSLVGIKKLGFEVEPLAEPNIAEWKTTPVGEW